MTMGGPGVNPLAGIKIVDMTAFVAAPTTPWIIGEWGADVIKVEAPKGDPARTQAPCSARPIQSTRISASTCRT